MEVTWKKVGGKRRAKKRTFAVRGAGSAAFWMAGTLEWKIFTNLIYNEVISQILTSPSSVSLQQQNRISLFTLFIATHRRAIWQDRKIVWRDTADDIVGDLCWRVQCLLVEDKVKRWRFADLHFHINELNLGGFMRPPQIAAVFSVLMFTHSCSPNF